MNMIAIKSCAWVMSLALVFAIPGQAEVYKSVDDTGKVIYSDQPAPNAEPVEIKQPNTAKPVDFRDRTPDATTVEEHYRVTIVSPTNQQSFPNRLKPFTVVAQMEPALREGQQLRLVIDGKTHSVSSGNFEVSNLSIGEHTLGVSLIDASGAAIANSQNITIFTRNPGS